MDDLILTHRKEVLQRIQMANERPEGSHNHFEKQMAPTPRDFARLVKHILAFANTPRRTDAYIVFGVNEDKDRGVFEHVGVPDQGFPDSETIYNYVSEHTSSPELFIDAEYELDGKRTPYIAIPLQFKGPHVLLRSIHGAPTAIDVGEIYCRSGNSSIRASERDVGRIQSDWDSWFLNSRYEKSASSLSGVLAKRFPNHTILMEADGYVRLVYDSEISDEFGKHLTPVLVHAYWGFEPVELNAVHKITADNDPPAFQKTIVGARFSAMTRAAAGTSAVRCVLLDEIYFVNDPYAQLCRAFIGRWHQERSLRTRGIVIDLDYGRTVLSDDAQASRTSVLSFLEEQLGSSGRVAVVVHGAFGSGKTTTAKQLVAVLCEDYLRGHTQVPKVIYIDVNTMDIRSRRDECIRTELANYRLSGEHLDSLLTQIRNDDIHIVFDGVDEMARPYTAAGRLEAIEILRDVGNRKAAVYFVRSSYYPELTHMLADFARLADHDFETGERRVVAAAIRGLRSEQVGTYLESRLGLDDTRTVRSVLHKAGLSSFLSDPLIVSLLAELVEKEGPDGIGSFPTKGQKAHFLSHLVRRLLQREQSKRQRGTALAADFKLFQRVLRAVAFKMICTGSSSLLPDRLEAFIQSALGAPSATTEEVDAFRTMSWIQRSEDGALAFRHEALTLVCAAEHVCTALESQDSLALSDWQTSAPLAGVVCDYAGEIIDGAGALGATLMMAGDIQFNVRQLASAVLSAASGRQGFEPIPPGKLNARNMAMVVRGVVAAADVARYPVRVLFASLGSKGIVQVGVPMLFLLGRLDSSEAIVLALEVLGHITGRDRHFCDTLDAIKDDTSSFVNSLLLKDLGINSSEIVDGLRYETLFKRIQGMTSLDSATRRYVERTLKAIEGEKHQRAARFEAQHKHKRRRRS